MAPRAESRSAKHHGLKKMLFPCIGSLSQLYVQSIHYPCSASFSRRTVGCRLYFSPHAPLRSSSKPATRNFFRRKKGEHSSPLRMTRDQFLLTDVNVSGSAARAVTWTGAPGVNGDRSIAGNSSGISLADTAESCDMTEASLTISGLSTGVYTVATCICVKNLPSVIVLEVFPARSRGKRQDVGNSDKGPRPQQVFANRLTRTTESYNRGSKRREHITEENVAPQADEHAPCTGGAAAKNPERLPDGGWTVLHTPKRQQRTTDLICPPTSEYDRCRCWG